LKARDESDCSVSWSLLYRASLFGLRARKFHESSNGAGKFVVVVRAENGRIVVAYNEDGFSSELDFMPNRKLHYKLDSELMRERPLT
jgi:hypothetical protein